ncbi:MAG: hypothetical protein NXI31_08640 [bacterium]|nr:hypothetical protein [bacterium]
MTDNRRRSPVAVTASKTFLPADSLLECVKRASLARQAQHTAWQLGAFLRRVAREAPDYHGVLSEAVDALLRLNLQYSSSLPDGSVQEPQQQNRLTRDLAASQSEVF